MENKIEELKLLGYDITNIIRGTCDPEVIARYACMHPKSNYVIKPMKWSEDSIIKFSNTVYRIVTGEKTYGQKD